MGSNGSRPVVGITTYVEEARWGAWERRAALVPHSYVAAVAEGGALPVLLPPLGSGAAQVVARLDGLVVSGGADVDPARYGASADARTDRPRTDRDEWEVALLDAAIAAGTPVLAICRGLQVLNVARGGTLHQHLPDVCGHDGHRPVLGEFAPTAVTLEPGTRLAGILGEAADVPCSHHQAVDAVGAGLTVAARSTDGTVEALELDGDAWVVGVQWHPEAGTDPRLVAAFVSECAR